MKICTDCRAQIPDEAVRCQYCTSWIDQTAQNSEHTSRVVYVVDKDLIRFGKFALAVLGAMIVIGVYLFGIDLKDTGKEVKTVREEVGKDRETIKKESDVIKTAIADMEKNKNEIEAIKQKISEMRSEAASAADTAKTVVADLMKSRETVQGIVGQTGTASGWIRLEIERHFSNVLPADQFDRLVKSLRDGAALAALPANRQYTSEEVLRLAQADVASAVAFYKSYGIDIKPPRVRIDQDPKLANAYWDGREIVYGMGMVNGDLFGPYSPTVALHEATHALFSIQFDGQSGTVSESVCDVIAALIDEQWTIGSVRNASGAPQVLRSLKAPGTAYDNPALGKDRQPDHMSEVRTEPNDFHPNIGILNKAAYLISEGGEHRGVKVGKGLGRDKTAKLYMEVIKKLGRREGQKVDFAAFKEIVVGAAREVLVDQGDRGVVTESFRAVGL
jgi:hypothetical protein